jgi:hypothetical protein
VQVDVRLQRTLVLLDERLSPPIESIRPGLVLSSLRALESDVRAYDTEEGRKEHAPDLIAALDDLSGTVRDFVSQFPRTREIVANQIALELVEEPQALEAAIRASEDLAAAAASHPELVDSRAPDSLREPKESAEGVGTTADQAKLVGLRLLTTANFVRIVAQARELAVASWDEARKEIPKAAGRAAARAVVLGGTGLFAHWMGHDPLQLVLATEIAIQRTNDAVGRRGGLFDRLQKTFKRIATLKPPAEADASSPVRKPAARRKTTKKKKAKK